MPSYDFEHNTQRDLERLRHVDDYTLRHLAVHLHGSGQHDKLHRLLVGNRAWMEAKSVRLSGYEAYVADLDLAMSDFADQLTPSQLLVVVQLNTARQTVHAEVSNYTDDDLRILVLLGREDDALSHARLRANAVEKFDGLFSVYKTLQERNQPDLTLLSEVEKVGYTSFCLETSGPGSHARLPAAWEPPLLDFPDKN